MVYMNSKKEVRKIRNPNALLFHPMGGLDTPPGAISRSADILSAESSASSWIGYTMIDWNLLLLLGKVGWA